MKFTRFLFFILILVTSTIQAQSYRGLGDQNFQFGYNLYGYGTGIQLTYDYGLNDQYSIGVGVNYFNTGKFSSRFFVFGRTDYHLGHVLDIPEKIDFYLGVKLGIIENKFLGLAGHFGGRYQILENFRAFIELGSNGALGLSLNF
jgi:hypothetical protein